MEIESGNKLKILSNERKDEITMLSESVEFSEVMEGYWI